MKIRVSCQDKYEAKKFASLLFLPGENETFVKEILNVIENELVLLLIDKSAHSILLQNSQEVEKFADFIQSVIEQKHKILGAKTFDEIIEITKG